VKPWRKIDERVVYDRFRQVTSRTFELPAGELADFEVIELFDSVVVLPLTATNKVVLVGEFRPGPEQILLELPGGVVDPGSSPIDAAETELLEETGFRGRLAKAGTMFKDGYATNTKHVFVATGCERVAQPEHPELTEPVLMSLSEFRKHLRGGHMTDTDAGYRALDFLGLL
jgi:ADP-ribose pyrophosphatase